MQSQTGTTSPLKRLAAALKAPWILLQSVQVRPELWNLGKRPGEVGGGFLDGIKSGYVMAHAADDSAVMTLIGWVGE